MKPWQVGSWGGAVSFCALALLGCGGDVQFDPETKPSCEDIGEGGAREGCAAPCESDAACDDTVFCNGREMCAPNQHGADARGCVAGAKPQCDDSLPCTVDECDPKQDRCVFTAPDQDGDDHHDASCRNHDGEPLGDDCDDLDAERFPGSSEVCDNQHDEDCDPNTVGERDDDNDGFSSESCCNDGICATDCDDSRDDVNPHQTEICDKRDNNCDKKIDNDPQEVLWYLDADDDNYGLATDSVLACKPQVGRVLKATDCDDSDPEVHPARDEKCDDQVDNNCNGTTDEGASCKNPEGTPTCSARLSLCGPTCADLERDIRNCGSCFHACNANELCSSGKCVSWTPGEFPAESEPCDDEDWSCAANDSGRRLECVDHVWTRAEPCKSGENCDTESNTCGTIVKACSKKDGGDSFCSSDESLYRCGVDRVSQELIKSCAPGFCDDATSKCADYCTEANGGCAAHEVCTSSEELRRPQCGECETGYIASSEGCTPRLVALSANDATISPAVASGILEYRVTTRLLRQFIELQFDAPPGASIAVEQQSLSGRSWKSPALSVGDNPFTLVISETGQPSTTYSITIERRLKEAYVKASNADAGDLFGTAVSISTDGGVIAVGAPGEDSGVVDNPSDNASPDWGAVYVFRRSSMGFSEEAYLKQLPANVLAPSRFGASVTLSGNGQYLAAASDLRLSVFKFSAGKWNLEWENMVSSTKAMAFDYDGSKLVVGTGSAVAMATRDASQWTWSTFAGNLATDIGIDVDISSDGSTVVAGAKNAAFWFRPDGSRTDLQGATTDHLRFGAPVRVSASGGTLAIGSPFTSAAGAVYVYSDGPAASLGPTKPLDGLFGDSIALSDEGSAMVIRERDGQYGGLLPPACLVGNANCGVLHIFRASPTWTLDTSWGAPNAGKGDSFGASLALSGDGYTLAVGAPGEDSSMRGITPASGDDSALDSGAVYIY